MEPDCKTCLYCKKRIDDWYYEIYGKPVKSTCAHCFYYPQMVDLGVADKDGYFRRYCSKHKEK